MEGKLLEAEFMFCYLLHGMVGVLHGVECCFIKYVEGSGVLFYVLQGVECCFMCFREWSVVSQDEGIGTR